MGTWEHRAILEGYKGTRIPPGRPSLIDNTNKEICRKIGNVSGEGIKYLGALVIVNFNGLAFS